MNSVTDDLIFKLLFSDERSKRMLIHLLSSIVGFQIADLDIRKSEMTPEFIGGKESRLDVLARDNEGRFYNVELQKRSDVTMRERSLFYWSEIFFKQLSKGAKYYELRKTICINILEENLFEDARFWHTYHMREDETHELLTDAEEIHFLEISKMREFKKDSPITWWLEYFKNPRSEVVKKIGEFEPIIKEAVKMFDIVSSDPQTQELMRMREKGERDFNTAVGYAEMRGKAKGKEEGRMEGKAEGRMEGMREMARNLLRNNVDINVVASSSGLSIDEIKSLKN